MLPSVTSILSFVKFKPEYEALIKWSNSLGFKHKSYNKTLDATADFGTLVHEVISKIVTHQEIPKELYSKVSFEDMDKFNTTISNFMKFHANLPSETIYSEKSFLSKELGYAGTVDWISKEDNQIILTDFKTSSAVRDYMPMQLAAYRKLIEAHTKYKINKARIILVSSPSFKIENYSLEQLDESYEMFEKIFELYKLYTSKHLDSQDANENSLIIVND